jgi:predicted nuclease of restriction endonuclease-like RecB superfamily
LSLPTTTTRKRGLRTISRRSQIRAIAQGYKSGLEDKLSRQIEDAGLTVEYETDKIDYVWPERAAKYTPDFKLPKPGGFFYVESKGRWTVDDRQKHLLIKDQHPEIDIRFVFSNANAKLYKGSPTTYAQWCDKFGFRYANKTIPQDWLEEGDA